MSSSKETAISIPFPFMTTLANVKVEFEEDDHYTLTEFPTELVKNEFPNGNYDDFDDESAEDICALNEAYFDHTSVIQQNLENVPMDGGMDDVDPLCGPESEYNHNQRNVHTGESNLTLTIHQDQTPTEETTCKTCGRICSSKAKLIEHTIIHIMEEDDKPVKCETCGRVYAGEPNLRRHKCRPGPRRPTKFLCRTCGKTFPTDAIRREHDMTIHTKVRSLAYSCKVCGMSFSLKASLDFHSSVHKTVSQKSKEFKFKCDECGKVLATIYNLNAHKSLHTGEKTKDYKCDVCGRFLSSLASLNCHKALHTEIRNTNAISVVKLMLRCKV